MAFAVLLTRHTTATGGRVYSIRDRILGTRWQISERPDCVRVYRDAQLETRMTTRRQAFDYVERKLGNFGLATRQAI